MFKEARRWAVLVCCVGLVCARPASADFAAGQAAYDAGDYETALADWRPLAEAGDAEAQYLLGVCYRDGRGVPQDTAEAVVWYRRAAEQGHDVGQARLGIAYLYGTGVRRNLSEAARWLQLAAEQNVPVAQSCLGMMYLYARGAPRDVPEAVAWYRKAAEQGELEAQWQLGNLYGRGLTLPRDDVEAYVWMSIAASRGVKPAQRAQVKIGKRLTPDERAAANARVRALIEAGAGGESRLEGWEGEYARRRALGIVLVVFGIVLLVSRVPLINRSSSTLALYRAVTGTQSRIRVVGFVMTLLVVAMMVLARPGLSGADQFYYALGYPTLPYVAVLQLCCPSEYQRVVTRMLTPPEGTVFRRVVGAAGIVFSLFTIWVGILMLEQAG